MGNSDESLDSPNVCDAVVDYFCQPSERTEILGRRFINWMGIAPSKFHDWRKRYGVDTEHNALVPRDWCLEDWEKRAILAFHSEHLLTAIGGLRS